MRQGLNIKDQFLKDFGSRIQQIRRMQGISQEELAHRAKIHRTFMGRIERGESNPPVFTFHKIALALKVNPSEFFSFKR